MRSIEFITVDGITLNVDAIDAIYDQPNYGTCTVKMRSGSAFTLNMKAQAFVDELTKIGRNR